MKTPRNGSEARENAGYRAAIGFGLTSDWWLARIFQTNHWPWKAKSLQIRIIFYKQFKIAPNKKFFIIRVLLIGVVFHVGTSSAAFQQILDSFGVIWSKP